MKNRVKNFLFFNETYEDGLNRALRCLAVQSEKLEQMEVENERLEESLADIFGAAVAQADMKENSDELHARDFLTKEMQKFLLALAKHGEEVTGYDPAVYCPDSYEEHHPTTTGGYLDLCGNYEHFWVNFGKSAQFYVVPQRGPVMELIVDYYCNDSAEEIYAELTKEFGDES